MTKYDDNGVPVEYHQPPDDIPKANAPIFEDEPSTAKVKIIGGMSEHALQNPPRIGEKRVYWVEAFCKKHELDHVDGETRLVCVMEHSSIYEKGKVPIVDEKRGEPGLFDDHDEMETIDNTVTTPEADEDGGAELSAVPPLEFSEES